MHAPAVAGDPFLQVLEGFAAAPSAHADARALLRRYDTKFFLASGDLPGWLAELTGDYLVLRAAGARVASYRTLYFDTADRRCFADHARGRLPRFKVRVRDYADRRVTFLEIKKKDNRGQTTKVRAERAFGDHRLAAADLALVAAHVPFDPRDLQPALWTSFDRVTLVAAAREERVAIDLGLRVARVVGARKEAGEVLDGSQLAWHALPGVAMIEVKQVRQSHHGPAMRALRALRAQPTSFSKYGAGMALTEHAARSNTFRPALRALARMSGA